MFDYLQGLPTFFFDFGQGTSDTLLPSGDDELSSVIPISTPFPFFGAIETELYVRPFSVLLISIIDYKSSFNSSSN